MKAIDHFENVLHLSPGTVLGEHAQQMMVELRNRQLSSESYRYFCIYD